MPKPDFATSYTNANRILVQSQVIDRFPFSVKQLIREQSDIHLCSFAKAIQAGLDIYAFGSTSADLIKYGDRKILFYNDALPIEHNRYSLLHEFGHDYNGHPLDCSDKELYDCFEIEANWFAAQLLMPEQLLRELQKYGYPITVPFLRKAFGVSSEAASKRIENLDRSNYERKSAEEKEFDDIILQRHQAFLDRYCKKRSNMYSYEEELNRQQERDSWY